MTSELPPRHQRPSLIEFFVGGELGRHGSKVVTDHHHPQAQQSHTKGNANNKIGSNICILIYYHSLMLLLLKSS